RKRKKVGEASLNRQNLNQKGKIMKAVVYMFASRRGYGFLKTPDGQEVFFHISNYEGTPKLGATVEYELGDPVRLGKPQQAVNVRPIQNAEVPDVEVSREQ